MWISARYLGLTPQANQMSPLRGSRLKALGVVTAQRRDLNSKVLFLPLSRFTVTVTVSPSLKLSRTSPSSPPVRTGSLIDRDDDIADYYPSAAVAGDWANARPVCATSFDDAGHHCAPSMPDRRTMWSEAMLDTHWEGRRTLPWAISCGTTQFTVSTGIAKPTPA